MFEKFGIVAEKTVSGLSRRQMLGHCGRGALTVAGALAAWLAMPASASANKNCPPGTKLSKCSSGGSICCPPGTRCLGEVSLFPWAPNCG